MRWSWAQFGHKPHPHLLDHLIRPCQERRRDGLEGKITGSGPFQDLVHEGRDPLVHVGEARSVAHQEPSFRGLLQRTDHRHAAPERELGDLRQQSAVGPGERAAKARRWSCAQSSCVFD